MPRNEYSNLEKEIFCAFVEDFVDKINEKCDFHTRVVVCQPASKNPSLRFLLCNTTEAGIVYDPACQLTDTPATIDNYYTALVAHDMASGAWNKPKSGFPFFLARCFPRSGVPP